PPTTGAERLLASGRLNQASPIAIPELEAFDPVAMVVLVITHRGGATVGDRPLAVHRFRRGVKTVFLIDYGSHPASALNCSRFADPDSGETIIAGMGELHLEIIKSRLVNEYGVHSEVGKPKVAYRQPFRRASDVEGKHVKQTGGRGQFGVVRVRFKVKETPEF